MTKIKSLFVVRRNERNEHKKASTEHHGGAAKVHNDRTMVYICSPYAGNVGVNVRNARAYCRYAYLKGYMPIAPHLHYPQFMDEENPAERKDGLAMGIQLLDLCEELWICGSKISSGMAAEIKLARERKMPIRYVAAIFPEED